MGAGPVALAKDTWPPRKVEPRKDTPLPENTAPKSTLPPENVTPRKDTWPSVNRALSKDTLLPENLAARKDTSAPEKRVPANDTVPPKNLASPNDTLRPVNRVPVKNTWLPENVAPRKSMLPSTGYIGEVKIAALPGAVGPLRASVVVTDEAQDRVPDLAGGQIAVMCLLVGGVFSGVRSEGEMSLAHILRILNCNNRMICKVAMRGESWDYVALEVRKVPRCAGWLRPAAEEPARTGATGTPLQFPHFGSP